MGYFAKFPFVTRTYGGNSIIGVNLTKRTGILAKYKEDSKYYITYSVQDGETPEIIADRFYDEASYSWIILMYNDIFDVFEEWPMDYNDLVDYCKVKYTNINGIHHYRSISTGLEVDSDHVDYDRMTVTNFEYEDEENDKKRNIKLLIPDYISTLVAQHNTLVSGE
jgi:hypothetical protein